MIVQRHVPSFVLGVLLAGPCAVVLCPMARAGDGGVEPRRLFPASRVVSVSISDREDGAVGGCSCAAPAAAPVVPPCSAAPECDTGCECCPCEAGRGAALLRIRTALNRFVQQVFVCPKCECDQPCCEERPTCTARPNFGWAFPRLLRESAPESPRKDENPFRDDSVQTPPVPRDAAAKPAIP